MLKWYKPIYFININEKQLPEVFQYLEQKQRFAYAEACYIVYADEYGKQVRFEEATTADQKVLETHLKTYRQNENRPCRVCFFYGDGLGTNPFSFLQKCTFFIRKAHHRILLNQSF
ncbi:hypothetical protein HQ51_0204650 [Bacillus altitudinis]|nr:hypothetical protein HQ51_0204650 [Bacillus altitudinis]